MKAYPRQYSKEIAHLSLFSFKANIQRLTNFKLKCQVHLQMRFQCLMSQIEIPAFALLVPQTSNRKK